MRSIRSGSLLAVWILAGAAVAGEEVRWDYTGENGPEHWGDLSEDFSTCRLGRSQSPIDIVNPVDADLEPIVLDDRGATVAATNNGHTLQVDVEPGSSLRADGRRFRARPVPCPQSERASHRWTGDPLEAHFVHGDDRGELAVLAVLFEDGPPSRGLATIGEVAPRTAGETSPIEVAIVALGFVPYGRAHYRCSGSLTTPPCTEGVLWLVLEEKSTVATDPVRLFAELIGEDARGPQPLNGRQVLH